MFCLIAAPALFCLVPLSLQSAQSSPPRARVFGKVVSEDGQGIAGARVFLVSRPLRHSLVGAVDRLEVRTLQGGKFGAQLLEGRAYTAWGQIKDEAGISMTQVIEAATAGRPLLLVRALRWPRLRVRVSGHEPWAGSDLELHVYSSTRNVVELPLTFDAEAEVLIPPLPGREGLLTIRTKDGLHVAVRSLDFTKDVRVAVDLAKPITVDLTVTSKASGKALGQAWVVQLPSMIGLGSFPPPMFMVTVGNTMADGLCRVRMPESIDPTRRKQDRAQYLLIGAPGHAATYVPIAGPTAKRRVSVALEAGSTLSGRVLRPDGKPAGGAQLLIATYVRAEGEPGYHAGLPPIPVSCGKDGRFEFHGLTLLDDFHVLALTPGLGLPARMTSPVHWLVMHAPARAARTDLGDIDLSRLSHLELQVRRADGSPATVAHVQQQDRKLSAWFDHVVDSRGQLSMLCPTTELSFGAFELRGGIGLARWKSGPGKQKRVLRLSQPVSVFGKVISASGKPAAGAWVRLWNRPTGPNPALQDLCFLQQNYQATTNAKGLFELRAAGIEGEYSLLAGLRTQGKWTISAEMPFTIDRKQIRAPQIRVELPEPTPTGPKRR